MTGNDIINIIKNFVKNEIPEIKSLLSSNEIPRTHPALLINYPTLKLEYEGNVLHKRWFVDMFLVSPVTLNRDVALSNLEGIVEIFIEKIKTKTNLNDNSIYYCEINGNIETGNVTFKANNVNYDFIGFKLNIIIYHWEV